MPISNNEATANPVGFSQSADLAYSVDMEMLRPINVSFLRGNFRRLSYNESTRKHSCSWALSNESCFQQLVHYQKKILVKFDPSE